jgi:hypothetical protein
MDTNECRTVIPAARSASGKATETILQELDAAGAAFAEATRKKFGARGEW